MSIFPSLCRPRTPRSRTQTLSPETVTVSRPFRGFRGSSQGGSGRVPPKAAGRFGPGSPGGAAGPTVKVAPLPGQSPPVWPQVTAAHHGLESLADQGVPGRWSRESQEEVPALPGSPVSSPRSATQTGRAGSWPHPARVEKHRSPPPRHPQLAPDAPDWKVSPALGPARLTGRRARKTRPGSFCAFLTSCVGW